MRDVSARRWGSRALDRLRLRTRPSSAPTPRRRRRNRKQAHPMEYAPRPVRRAYARAEAARVRAANRGPRMTCAGPSEKALARQLARDAHS
jgi:hypothetical protein